MTPLAGGVVHPRFAARRSAARATTWWGRAWVRAVEESSYSSPDLALGRRLSRAGGIGGITVVRGGYVAAVEDEHGLWTVAGGVPVLDDASVEGLVEAVAAEAGRVASLLAGELPHALVEHAEEAGVELLPYGGELETTCTCDHWADPCPHALGVLQQLAWLVDGDPFVLLHLRGVPRDELLARLHERAEAAPVPQDADAEPGEVDVESGLEAALRAARVLELLEEQGPVDHLF